MAFEKFDRLIPKSISRAGAGRQVEAALVLDAVVKSTADVLGPRAAERVTAVKFRQGTVTLRCDEAALTDEVRMYEQDILRGANAIAGEGTVRRIKAIS
ncbi:DciA family protein [Patescibacteria group bacterium]